MQVTNFDPFFSFLEIMSWLHIVLGVTISRDPLLQKANCSRTNYIPGSLVKRHEFIEGSIQDNLIT